MAKTATKKKPVPKPKQCKCMDLVDAELKNSNLRLARKLQFHRASMTAGLSDRVYIMVEKIDKKKKNEPTVVATFCPFCGKKYKD